MGTIPQPPIEKRFISKRPGTGRDPVDRQRTPRFTVDHSMVGTLLGSDSWFRQDHVAALTDFGIGQANFKDGYARIFQWNDYNGRQIGWASGPVVSPMGDGPSILAKFGGATGLNQFGVSIEHEDGGNPTTEVTSFQWSATAWLHAWLHGEVLQPRQTADTFQYNTHHREFCGPSYKDCPFPRIYNYTTEFHEAIKHIMRHWQDDVSYPANGVWVAGKKLTVPVNKGIEKVERAGMKITVPGTQKEFWIVEPFLTYYNTHGGFAEFGYPETGMYREDWGEAKGLLVQYWERKRLEQQPDGTITEGRLGSELLSYRGK